MVKKSVKNTPPIGEPNYLAYLQKMHQSSIFYKNTVLEQYQSDCKDEHKGAFWSR